MNRFAALSATAAASACLAHALSHAMPSVYPTGTTIYDPERAWNGYTVFITPRQDGVVLVDMNGNTVKQWAGFEGLAGGPARVLPGGHVVGPRGDRRPHQESPELVQLDWDGDVVWRFDRNERVENDDGETVWAARQHHDWQREGDSAGYYAPESEPAVTGGRTLMLTHTNVTNADVSRHRLEDDRLIEVDWEGNIVWEWRASDHADGFGFSGETRALIRDAAAFNEARGSTDWLHINSATWVGPNRWHDDGDERFHPENVVISSRQANIIAIVSRETGEIVWRMGPDYRESDAWLEIGQIVGQHHPHIIPKGLPGAGNLLVFDNGGSTGYGFANPTAPGGIGAVRRHFSRVLEIDPVTFEKVWEYSMSGQESFRFFGHYVSAAQRLPNGNTLITEGSDGRLFEVTRDGEIVWEYVSPYFSGETNRVYRAYRVPYEWVPQLETPEERAVEPPDPADFRIEPR